MCFSAGADVVAGVVVGAIGLDGLRHVRRPAEMWLASLPLVLAAHQLVEAVVWLGLQGRVSEDAWRPALGRLPGHRLRRAAGAGTGGGQRPGAARAAPPAAVVRAPRGGGGSVVLMYAVVRGPVDARIRDLHIDYSVDLWQRGRAGRPLRGRDLRPDAVLPVPPRAVVRDGQRGRGRAAWPGSARAPSSPCGACGRRSPAWPSSSTCGWPTPASRAEWGPSADRSDLDPPVEGPVRRGVGRYGPGIGAPVALDGHDALGGEAGVEAWRRPRPGPAPG